MTTNQFAPAPQPDQSVPVAAMHDFSAKLLQPSLIGRLANYVRWQAARRSGSAQAVAAGKSGESAALDALQALDDVPVSINLDLTTACNYACDHCVDFEILNTGRRFDHERLLASLEQLARRGLKSVIVIGGGEPTLYPGFAEVISRMKALGLQIGLVTNGTGMEKVLAVADVLDARDWVRLSLDASSDATFQAMHKPRRKITLDEICAGIPPVKDRNPALRIGFSFIITWRGCSANESSIVENVHEMALAAERARRFRFDYISFKPFLVRADENNAEIVDLAQQAHRVADVMGAIRLQVQQSRRLETARFQVLVSTNLRVFLNHAWHEYSRQPQQCHMTQFRQVLSPLGTFNCPVYRHVDQARLGDLDTFADDSAVATTQASTAALIERFDASHECRHVTCLYNPTNWFIEDLIRDPSRLEALRPTAERHDYFL